MLTEVALAAVALNGLLAGASLDQSIKQVPSRNRIGVRAYAIYVRGADLGNGVLWYALLANAAALATVAAAFLGWRAHAQGYLLLALMVGGLLSIAHTLATLKAAPTMLSSRTVSLDDELLLEKIFDRFARWQAVRVTLQVLAFGSSLWSASLAWSAA
jgi:hypothetical protein